MKVGFVSHSASLAGAERFLIDTIKALASVDVSACVVVPRSGPLCDRLRRAGVPFAVIPYGWWAVRGERPLWRRAARHSVAAPAAAAIAAYFAAQRCDVLFTNTAMVYVGALAAKLLRRPHVWQLHEIRDLWSFDFGERLSAELMRRTTARFIANSRATRQSYAPVLRDAPIDVIYQWVDVGELPERRRRAAGDPFRCVVVGSLNADKGQHEAIEAVASLRQRGLDVRLELVGDGANAYRDELRRLADSRGLNGALRFVGYAEQAIAHIREADAVLVTSRHEGFGRVTVEAMLVGTPVIANRTGGTPELVEHEQTGLLYEPGDARALAGCIAELVNGESAGQLTSTARSRAAAQTSARYGESLRQLLVAETREPRST